MRVGSRLILVWAMLAGGAFAGELDVDVDIVPVERSMIETTVYVARNEEIVEALDEASAAEARGDWTAAVDIRQRIIEGRIAPEDASGTMVRTGDAPLFITGRESARRALAAMPSAGIKHYRSLYNEKAAALLAGARRSRNAATLRMTAELYPASSSADDALDALGELYFETARPARALWAWRRLLMLCRDSDLPRGAIHLKMAVCARMLGDDASAGAYLAKARAARPVPLLMGRDADDLPSFERNARYLDQWPMLGGDPSRSGIAAGTIDPGAVEWSFAISQPDITDAMIEGYARRGHSAPLIHEPVAADGRIIISGTVVATALSPGGKLLWTYPPGGALPGLSRIDDRMCGGQVSGGVYYTVLDGRPHAINAATGELVWRASEDLPDPGDNIEAARNEGPMLGGGNVVSPPVVVGGRLWCAVTRYRQEAESCLAMFDLATGKLERKVFLCSHNSADHIGVGSMPAPPAAVGGAILVCSNTGVVAAIDRLDGSIRWLHRYNFILPILKRQAIRAADRWANGPVVSAAGRVFAAPQDSEFIFAFDLRTGEMLWRQPRSGRRYLAGVAGDVVLVSGSDVAGIHASTGKLLWRSPKLSGKPAGRPVLTASGLVVPTTDGLHRVDTKTGEASMILRWGGRGRPGNLVSADGKLLIAWEQGLTAVEGWQTTLKRLGAERTPTAKLELAAVSRRRGDAAGAARIFAEALELAKDNEPLTNAINDEWAALDVDQALTAAKEARWADAAKHYGGAADRAASAAIQIEALAGRAEALELLARWADAVDAWQRMLIEHRADMHEFSKGHNTRCNWYARGRIDRILASAGLDAYARHEADTAKLLAAGKNDDRSPWLKIWRLYPNSASVGPALLRLAGSYAAEPDKALHYLRRYVQGRPGDAETAAGLLRLASKCREVGRLDEAAAALRRIVDEFPDVTPAGQFGSASETAELELKRPEFAALRQAPPALVMPIVNRWRGPARLSLNSPVITKGAHGSVLIAQSVFSKIFMFGMRRPGMPYDNLVCRDLADGRLLWARSPGEWTGRVIVTEKALLLPGLQQLLALDPASGRTLWIYTHGVAREFGLPDMTGRPKPIPGAERFKTLITVEADRINNWAVDGGNIYVAGTGGRLTCVDLETGKAIWEQESPAGTQSGSLIVSNGLVAIAKSMPARVLIYDAETGNAKDLVGFETRDNRMTDKPALFTSRASMAAVLGDLTVHFIDLTNAAVEWQHKCNFSIGEVRPTPDETGVIIVPNALAARGKLQVLDVVTGGLRWELELGPGELESVADGANRIAVLLRRFNSSIVRCYDTDTGKQLWETVPLGRMRGGGMRIASGCVVVWGDDIRPSAVLLSADDGGVLQRVAPKGAEQMSAGLVEGTFITATNRGSFAYGNIDTEDISARAERRLADIKTLRAQARTVDAQEATLDAACLLLQLHNYRRARDILAEALSDPAVAPVIGERLFDRLAAAREAIAEQTPPQLHAYKFERPPTIDGAIDDDWHAFESVRLEGPEAMELLLPGPGNEGELLPWAPSSENDWPPRWAGPNDLSARLYVGWDDEFFYIAVDIDDNIHRSFRQDGTKWIGDGLFMSIDCENDGGYKYGADDQVITLALVDKPKEDKQEDDQPGGEYHVKIKPDQSGVVYEIALPWDYLKRVRNPGHGTRFGLNITVLDDDGSGSSKSVSWTPGLFLHSDRYRLLRGFSPELFGDIILIDPKAAKRKPAPKPDREP